MYRQNFANTKNAPLIYENTVIENSRKTPRFYKYLLILPSLIEMTLIFQNVTKLNQIE